MFEHLQPVECFVHETNKSPSSFPVVKIIPLRNQNTLEHREREKTGIVEIQDKSFLGRKLKEKKRGSKTKTNPLK